MQGSLSMWWWFVDLNLLLPSVWIQWTWKSVALWTKFGLRFPPQVDKLNGELCAPRVRSQRVPCYKDYSNFWVRLSTLRCKVPSSMDAEILLRIRYPPHTLEKFYWFFRQFEGLVTWYVKAQFSTVIQKRCVFLSVVKSYFIVINEIRVGFLLHTNHKEHFSSCQKMQRHF
jgi:hypothetical protein